MLWVVFTFEYACTSYLKYSIAGVSQTTYVSYDCPDHIGCQLLVNQKPLGNGAPTEVQDGFYAPLYESYISLGTVAGMRRELVRVVCAAATTESDCNKMCKTRCERENNAAKLRFTARRYAAGLPAPDNSMDGTLPNFYCPYSKVTLPQNPRPFVIWLPVLMGVLVYIAAISVAIPTYYCMKKKWKCACKRGKSVFTAKMIDPKLKKQFEQK